MTRDTTTADDSPDNQGRPHYAVERHQVLVQTVRSQGRLDAGAMAEQLQVSTETIRKDLQLLERRGLLRRVHGGAIAVEDLSFEPEVSTRTSNEDEKRRIARAALAEVPREGAVFLDAGSTITMLAEMFPADRALNVFTNTLTIALALVSRPRLNVHTLGGRVRARTFAEVDNWAIRALSEIQVDVAFLGTNAISSERGLSTPDESEATVKRLMLSAARRRVLLADHTKHDRTSLYKYGNLSDIDLLITDDGLSEQHAHRLEAAGLKQVVRT
ncbi:DeoR/GlpR family DNA-binding transcription regulator [Streptomyces sp. NBC_01622]|uniref:DeoR/GlpR family DNA-binding transcription regulator n=1 Tax=Streptomyces sp. NBC_01622 TaxID=2975903 RepID=UPI003866DC3B|nr:DeoR/GlpR family DNA-binding transcription regulator [Streptomyces sp. NBC_01622]